MAENSITANLAPVDVVPEKQNVDWNEAAALSVDVANQVKSRAGDDGVAYDLLLFLGRGGLMPNLIISSVLGFQAPQIYHAGITSYEAGINKLKPGFETGQFPTHDELAGQNILIIDEVCDSGRTLNETYNRVKQSGALVVRTAVLHYKPANSVSGIVPDFYAEQTAAWIVYPWEKYQVEKPSIAVAQRAVLDAIVD